MAATGDDGGYWLVASDGGVFPFGDAGFFGSAGGLRLNKPVVGMAATPDDGGYWMVATDGGIFSYGDAQFYGSTGSIQLNQPIVGMAATPDGGGYWLVASDGGIFAYGDAQFYGSTGQHPPEQADRGHGPRPPTAAGTGWSRPTGASSPTATRSSTARPGSIHLAQPIVGMAAMPDGGGYWFTAADGGLFNYGTAPFYGSAAGTGIGTVVGMATDGAPTLQAAPTFRETAACRRPGAAGTALPANVKPSPEAEAPATPAGAPGGKAGHRASDQNPVAAMIAPFSGCPPSPRRSARRRSCRPTRGPTRPSSPRRRTC